MATKGGLMSKSPAFQFYVKDWLASTKVRLMSHAERGAYMDLLCHTWNEDDCSLNNDDDELSILSGLGDKWHGKAADKIKACFKVKGARLVHERLLAEREKQKMHSEKCKKAGMASGKARRTKELGLNERSPHVEPKPNIAVCSLQSSSSSSIASTSSKNKEKDIHVFEEIVSHLNELLGTGYKVKTSKTQRLIKARLDEGFTVEDFKHVHEIKHAEWKDGEYAKFLRPETLYGTKFESYLNQKAGQSKVSKQVQASQGAIQAFLEKED